MVCSNCYISITFSFSSVLVLYKHCNITLDDSSVLLKHSSWSPSVFLSRDAYATRVYSAIYVNGSVSGYKKTVFRVFCRNAKC